jgi:myo-inositol-1(or 4)-monophosphatase
MRTPSSQQLLDVAVAAARAAGDHARANLARRHEVFQRAAHDVKLQLDLECQAQTEAVIHQHFPAHAFLGEEGGDYIENAEHLWIVDPIDGTVNFSHGLPLWCASVAVRQAGRIVAGAVYAPMLQQLYTATAEGPALCNGQPLRVSTIRNLAEAVVLTGIFKEQPRSLELFAALTRALQKVRIYGSAALDLCLLASGQAEGYFESKIYLWDIAAAGLIAERAGARVEVLERFDALSCRLLASNGHLHAALKTIARAAYP